MPKLNTARGSTSRIDWIFLPDSTSTVGAGKTALTSASAGLNITARRELAAAVSTYTGANIGAVVTLGTWVNPGAGKINIKEVDATNLPGLYELHFVDLLFAVGDGSRWIGGMVTATGIAPSPFQIALEAVDAQNLTSLGLANVDAAVSTRAATGAAMTLTAGERTSIADAYLDRADAIETGLTPRQAQRLYAASLAGVLAGAGTTTVTIKNAVANTKVRITATVDVDGNRSVVITDVT